MKEVKVAIAGNPNTGKTTIFNALTGTRQQTGNWPGVTVEKKEGKFEYKGETVGIIDLPGTYSLTSYTIDERVARDFLVKEKPDVAVVVVDASNLERNFYLVTLLLELGQNVVVDLNMMDIAKEKGIDIDTEKLERILKIPFVETIGHKSIGIDNLKKRILESAKEKEKEIFDINYGEFVEEELKKLESEIFSLDIPYPHRFFTLRLLENDSEFLKIIEKGKNPLRTKEILENIKKSLGEPEDYLIEKRYGFIHGLIKECVSLKRKMGEKIELTDKLDRIFTNRFLGLPLFFFFMWLTFQMVFKWGGALGEGIDNFFGILGDKSKIFLTAVGSPSWLISLLKDGIISGVGSVLVFFPNIFILFFVFAILEDSGYMARVAFVMDKIMHKLGLHGKSSIPMILGFGCNVPAIMATRTLESRTDRILTILINPFMSCSARLPVYILFAGVFFSSHRGTVVFSLYLLGVIVAVLSARLFKSLFFKEEDVPLIMELPPYHIPTIKNVLLSAWSKALVFLKKAGTVIFAVVVLVWLLGYFPLGVKFAGESSLIGRIGKIVAPVFRPAGFGFWQAAVALLFGILAKEVVVGTFGTLYGGEERLSHVLPNLFTPVSAYSFMLITLLYIPCIATIAVIKQEAGTKWAVITTVWSLFVGWTIAVVFYQLAILF